MFSQYEEEEIILEYFKDSNHESMSFLDIGANDGITFSNTHKLALLGWNGICLDPSPGAFDKLENLYKYNNKITCYNFGISNIIGKLELNESLNWVGRDDTPIGILSCIDSGEKNRFYGMNWRTVYCDFFTFDHFLNNSKISKFNFINIDCEGHDFVVLSQIDLNLVECDMVCIEYTELEHIELYNEYFLKFNFNEHYRTKDNILFVRRKY
jgi:FkbM family methyltransferase